jgi:3',5'-cyclic AMP phosphodiesterase CpdA
VDKSTNLIEKKLAGMKATDHAGLYFAQLSDPHLTSLQRVRWRQLLNKRMLGYLSWHQKRRAEHRGEVLEALLRDLTQTRPEHIVITGDLTHIGLPDEFRQARRWLDRLGATDRVTVVPGNHDAYVRSPWSSTFSLWQPYMQSDPEFAETPDTASEQLFPSLRIRNGVALIGLSSAGASAPFLATGSLGLQQRQRLTMLLRQAAEQGLFRIVLLHHPPREEDEKWRKRLTDGKALCAILEREGAELVLHGHSHRAVEAGIPHGQGKIPVFGIPSASAIGRQAGRRAQYYLYKVRREDDHWSVRVSVRGYQPDQDRFSLQHEHHLSMPVIASTSF